MKNDTVDNLKEKVILFVISPLAAFLYSLQDVKTKSSYFVFFLFCTLFGWMLIADFEFADAYVYKNQFLQFAVSPDHNMRQVLSEYFTPDSLEKDIYRYVLFWLAAKIGGTNYHILFMLAAVFFSYFYLKSMRFVTDNPHFEQGFYGLILLFLFTYSNCIFNINGFRFWTASWIGVYAILKILKDHNFLYLLLLIILPFIHVSMPLLIIMVALSWIMRKRMRIVIPLLVSSFFVSVFALKFLELIQPYLPPVFQGLIWSYTQSTTALDGFEETGPLYAQILSFLPFLLLMAMTVLLLVEKNNFTSQKGKEVLGFYLVFYTITNILAAIPSGVRFTFIAMPILVYVWIENYDVMKKYNMFWYLIPVAFSYRLLYLFRNLMEMTTSIFYMAPLPYQIFYNL